MARIGLFGGTFDPPHTGHIALAKKTLNAFSLDKIIFIPAGNPPHKTDKKITDKSCRYDMIALATKNDKEFLLSDFDIKNEKPNYSYLTIEHFKKTYPDDEIFFIVGADSYRDFPLWKNFPDILSLCTFIVVNRPGIDTSDCYSDCYLKYLKLDTEHKALFLDDFSYDLSSTYLRKNLALGKDCKDFLPKGVYDYIKKHNLYSKESL